MALSAFQVLLCVLAAASGEHDFLFDKPDLSLVQNAFGKEFRVEAFPATQNDAILKNIDIATSSHLRWVSLGRPQLVASSAPESRIRFFHFSSNQMTVQVSLLNQKMREGLAQDAKRKYGIRVAPDQISTVPLSNVECTLPFKTQNEVQIQFHGRALNLQENPLTISFDTSNRLRSTLEQQLQATVSVRCKFFAFGKQKRVEILTISTDHMQELNVTEQLFCSMTSVYVTRQQMIALADHAYTKLSIEDEYSIPLVEFRDRFINDFVQQATGQNFTQVPIRTALAALSKYETFFVDNFNVDNMLRAADSIFSVDTQIIDVNKQLMAGITGKAIRNCERIYTNRMNRDLKSLIETFDLYSVMVFVCNNSQHWSSVSSSLGDQLGALNVHTQNVQWAIENNKVIAKNVSVALLQMELFPETLRFPSISKNSIEAPFQREFDLSTAASAEHDDCFMMTTPKEVLSLKEEISRQKKQTAEKEEILWNMMHQVLGQGQILREEFSWQKKQVAEKEEILWKMMNQILEQLAQSRMKQATGTEMDRRIDQLNQSLHELSNTINSKETDLRAEIRKQAENASRIERSLRDAMIRYAEVANKTEFDLRKDGEPIRGDGIAAALRKEQEDVIPNATRFFLQNGNCRRTVSLLQDDFISLFLEKH